MKLDKWCVVSRSFTAWQPPEQARCCLHGLVSGHPRCADGKPVTTSLMIGCHQNRIVTKSGSEYELGEVDAAYETLYPNAQPRLLATLRSLMRPSAPAYEI
jgi:hypothetical protein